jgi:hypothetical protein
MNSVSALESKVANIGICLWPQTCDGIMPRSLEGGVPHRTEGC